MIIKIVAALFCRRAATFFCLRNLFREHSPRHKLFPGVGYGTMPTMYGDRLKQNGVHLTDHEWATVKLLLDADSKRTVELIPPMGGDKVHTPDIETDSIIWEIKAPEGGGKNTIRHNLERAKK